MRLCEVIVLLMTVGCSRQQPEVLQFEVDKPIAIEVGGPYVGVAFHHSHMIPQRISFYYPVANSLDPSQDYWTRDTSFVARWNLQIDQETVNDVGLKPKKVYLTPTAVTFQQKVKGCDIEVAYRFCATQPAMVVTYNLKNTSRRTKRFVFDTELNTTLRTCHTYRPVPPDSFDYSSERGTAYLNYADADVKMVTLFIANPGEQPVQATADNGHCRLTYARALAPDSVLQIVQIIGTAPTAEVKQISEQLLDDYQSEVTRFEQLVQEKSKKTSLLKTNDPHADFSAAWAKAVLEANRHYLDGAIVPMPCPAEYNFFFTHDVLVTDLGAVAFDLERVKKDLEFIARHAAADGTIPHAYYWKDGRYQTELAGEDNWNNQWFIILVGRYLRHSGDRELVAQLYPLLTHSLKNILQNQGSDNLIWSRHPDWWDIGNDYGPRAYMTILTIAAISEYIYLSRRLNRDQDSLLSYLSCAQKMQTALTTKLWSEQLGYLINYRSNGRIDTHYYAGSLLAAHLGLLNEKQLEQLITTARRRLLVKDLGVQIVAPPDFHDLGQEYRFVGNEVGAPFYYLNGGIWANGNAWYTLALLAADEKEEAVDFMRRNMAITGIFSGPNGQPAYYEVRSPDPSHPALYGKVDKPQFMWAAGWYLYCLYRIFGLNVQNGNIGLMPQLAGNLNRADFTLFIQGEKIRANVQGKENLIQSIKYDGQDYPSAIFPLELKPVKQVEIITGRPRSPYLQQTTAILRQCRWHDSRLELDFVSIAGFPNETVVITPRLPEQIFLNGEPLTNCWYVHKFRHHYELTIDFKHQTANDRMEIQF